MSYKKLFKLKIVKQCLEHEGLWTGDLQSRFEKKLKTALKEARKANNVDSARRQHLRTRERTKSKSSQS